MTLADPFEEYVASLPEPSEDGYSFSWRVDGSRRLSDREFEAATRLWLRTNRDTIKNRGDAFAAKLINRLDVLADRDGGWRCFYCRVRVSVNLPIHHRHRAVADHVLPKYRGGSDDLENLVLSCWYCNSRKGRKYPEEVLNPEAPLVTCWRSLIPVIERLESAA